MGYGVREGSFIQKGWCSLSLTKKLDEEEGFHLFKEE